MTDCDTICHSLCLTVCVSVSLNACPTLFTCQCHQLSSSTASVLCITYLLTQGGHAIAKESTTEEAQRHQSCFLTEQTLWDRNVNLCCDKADLLFCSRGIVPAGGEKTGEGELRMMGIGKKIAVVEREVRRGK
ncbi:hypothetical protein D4764_14G0010280 [Takifugu flavidus]|uniref:Uncharacterized protein n=1 Tax=Takifugu flavidus TaxID=433684 RepID=A0A5C6P6I0_9TELE|nr:hypothetical protein D4764_14G0010280 [Takifugu flavidus]